MAISLSSIAAPKTRPPITLVYGESGLGKTTFACSAPAPVVIRTEDGMGRLETPSFPVADKFEDVLDAIAALYSEDHDFGTVVVDSLDWAEPLIWDRVCRDHGIATVEALPYGKAYVEALTYWRQMISGLRALRDEKDMLVIMTAHSQIIRVEDPTQPAYDTHTIKLHKRAAAVVLEAADLVLYAALKTMVKTEEAGFGNKRSRAITTGDRIMHTVGQPAYVAKNRYGLPPTLPLSWDALMQSLGDNTPTAAVAVNQ